ncbi:MAG: hypothetical protein ACR2PH_11300, partial [Desulfobulbia bacterium]
MRRIIMMKKTIVLLALAGLVLAIAPAAQAAVITVVDTDSAHTDSTSNPNDFTLSNEGAGNRDGIYSYSYDAGASFDMLVVSVSREAANDVELSVTYGGVDMDLATGLESASGATIYYLATTEQSGTIAASFIGTDVFNGCGIGIAAIKSDNGDPISLIDAAHETGYPDGPTSITINPTVDGSFSFFAIDNNQKGQSGLNAAPLTQIYSNIDVGSSGAGASYDLDVAAGSITYSYTVDDPTKARSVAAANFAVGGGEFNFDPTPGDGDIVAAADTLTLSWSLPDCNNVADLALVDVYWDTDEFGDSIAGTTQPLIGVSDANTVDVSALDIGTYYWKIVATDPNTGGVPFTVESVFSLVAVGTL